MLHAPSVGARLAPEGLTHASLEFGENSLHVVLVNPADHEIDAFRRDPQLAVHTFSVRVEPAADLLSRAQCDSVVYTTGRGSCPPVTAWSELAVRGKRVVVRSRLSAGDFAELALIASGHPGIRFATIGTNSGRTFSTQVCSLLGAQDGGPMSMIFSQFGDLSGQARARELVTAVALGSAESTVSMFGEWLGVSERSLQHTLRRASLPTPLHLLRWGRAIWFAWRFDRVGMSSKQLASTFGYANAATMYRSLHPFLSTYSRAQASGETVRTLVSNYLRARHHIVTPPDRPFATSPSSGLRRASKQNPSALVQGPTQVARPR